jgi:methyltransferase (TIGR00027 family)
VVALSRAIESARPEGDRLFHDPFAVRFLGFTTRSLLSLVTTRGLGPLLLSTFERIAPGLHGFSIARTIFIDRALRRALARGVPQVVILGAGYDSRAYRIPGIDNARVFEVDHPDTQAVKRARLAKVFALLPAHVTFVAIDFNRQDLKDRLVASGYRFDLPTFFIWEGVTEYLEGSAVDATLRILAQSPPASEVVFTYTDRGLLDGSREFPAGRLLLWTSRVGGEPYTFGIAPKQMADFLRQRGFELLDDASGDDFTDRYFRPGGRGDRANGFERVALARVLRTDATEPEE